MLEVESSLYDRGRGHRDSLPEKGSGGHVDRLSKLADALNQALAILVSNRSFDLLLHLTPSIWVLVEAVLGVEKVLVTREKVVLLVHIDPNVIPPLAALTASGVTVPESFGTTALVDH